ncbi:phytanoyl-CoA dioxygenase family protein [Streptomyces radicis]|nr:phytanoyl-CoA dioxygenase family protein [Streptomyces radicis]
MNAQLSEVADLVSTVGWAIAKNRLDPDQIHSARTLITAHFAAGGGVLHGEAQVQPAAAHFVPGLSWLYAHPQVVELARSALGTRDIIFTGHSDAHQGFAPGWHKDSGSEALGDSLCGYFGESPEELFTGPPEVVKVGIYLQDSTSDNCLRVDPKSHLRPHVQPVSPAQVLMDAGDLVVFDVRITHAGAVTPEPDSPQLTALRERVSAFVTFGRNTQRTKRFSQANMARQRDQLSQTEGGAPAADAGHVALLVSQGVGQWQES